MLKLYLGHYYDYLIAYFAVMLLGALMMGLVDLRAHFTCKKYAKVYSRRGDTADRIARRILDDNGLGEVAVQPAPDNGPDHYDHKQKTVFLSDAVYGSASVAAIGLAAQEAGRAVQYADHYAPLKIRRAIIMLAKIGVISCYIVALIGISTENFMLYTVCYVLIPLLLVLEYVTLPVEFDAGRRAMAALNSWNTLDEEELGGIKKVLTAAALSQNKRKRRLKK